MDYQESIDWVYNLQNNGIKLDLSNVEEILLKFDLNRFLSDVDIIHVAGTNGKGSVCRFSEKILRDLGLVTGLFTSPHLVSYRERIEVSGDLISSKSVFEFLTMIRSAIEDYSIALTFFEVTFILSILYFKKKSCDVIILETGMGGRLDATNIVVPNVSVITSIGLDHQEFLGKNISEIAIEKAGIIKPFIPVIIGDFNDQAREIVGKRAYESQSPCIEFKPLPDNWDISLKGNHQRINASLGVEAACRVVNCNIPEDLIIKSLVSVVHRGRYQKLNNKIILDGAHNIDSILALVDTFNNEFGEQKCNIIFGSSRSEGLDKIFYALSSIVYSIFFVTVSSKRGIKNKELHRQWNNEIANKLIFSKTTDISTALEEAKNCDSITIITGSLFLIGEVLCIENNKKYRETMQ